MRAPEPPPGRVADDGPDGVAARASWHELQRLVDGALDRPPGARDAYLDDACGTDTALRSRAARLVDACERAERAGGVLAGPAAAFAGPLLAAPSALGALRAALTGRYTVDRELGRGGMATVYLARDLRHDRAVAIKVLARELGDGAERFLREIRIAARLTHPHVLGVHDSGEGPGLLYYVMPYVDGETLRARLAREGALPLADAVRLLRELADALAYAHEGGVVHRDLKPENVLLSGGHAVVADFGIAQALAAAARDGPGAHGSLTAPGVALGTPGYMAPEQAAGERAVDHRADLYALGVVAYEVLTGRPPFPERSARLLLAAHARAAPEEIAARRPDVPRPLAALVMRLLAKRPADRPQSAAAVVRCLDALMPLGDAAGPGGPGRRVPRPRRRARAIAGAAAGGLIAALGAWRAIASRPAALDADRVVVFPLRVAGAGLPESAGEDAATLLGYALDGTAPLRWLEATDYMTAAERGQPRLLSGEDRRRIGRSQRAGFYIDGSVVRQGDSATVIVRLYSVAGDSVVARRAASGPLDPTSAAAPVAAIGLRAVGELLVPLLEPGRRVDASALSDRRPAAIAAFLQGEREYRASRFAAALEHYRVALSTDSLLALAALKGAQAASWLERPEDAAHLARRALAQASRLPPHRVWLARGLAHYLAGTADSAVAELRRVVAFDSSRSEPWMALGEVYRHLLPDATGIDSLARDAFARARRLDTTFTPPLYHLAEYALARGALGEAAGLIGAYDRAQPDRAATRPLDLSLRCVRDGAGSVDWARMADTASESVLQAGVLLAGGAAHARCAQAALWAALNSRGAPDDLRWSALLVLQSLLVAAGREADVVRLLRSPAATGLDAEALLLLDAAAGEPGGALRDGAADVARRLGHDYAAMRPYTLWLLGGWEGALGEGERVRAIASVLTAKADSSRARGDSLRARAIDARLPLVAGDTGRAIRRLRALAPTAPHRSLQWYPWEGLGGERLALAALLLARHDYAGAERAASRLDSSHPVVYLLYLRPSLRLRLRSSEAAGDVRGAARLRERLVRLARDTAALPWAADPPPSKRRGT
jgi:serine/threonine-protein kinase